VGVCIRVTYIHTYIHRVHSIHAWSRVSVFKYIHTCMHTYIHRVHSFRAWSVASVFKSIHCGSLPDLRYKIA
jgi:hypothetical protein